MITALLDDNEIKFWRKRAEAAEAIVQDAHCEISALRRAISKIGDLLMDANLTGADWRMHSLIEELKSVIAEHE